MELDGHEVRPAAAAAFTRNRQKRALLVGVPPTSQLHLADLGTPDKGPLGDIPDRHRSITGTGGLSLAPGALTDLDVLAYLLMATR